MFRLPASTERSAFSLIELVIVVAIIAVIGAIAIPRMSASSENAYAAAMLKDWRELQNSGELFKAEHGGIGIGVDDRSNPITASLVVKRLVSTTTDDGSASLSGTYGPYLSKIPTNRDNGMRSIRVDGALPGAGTHGWRLDSSTGVFAPDTLEGINAVESLGGPQFERGAG